jgi:hypothetical protein
LGGSAGISLDQVRKAKEGVIGIDFGAGAEEKIIQAAG